MLDLKIIRDDPEAVKANCINRRMDVDVDRIVELALRKSELTMLVQDLQRQQNDTAKSIGKIKDPAEREYAIHLGKELRVKVADAEKELETTTETLAPLHARVPNFTHPDSPQGADAKDRVVKEVGKRPEFDFKPLDHVALCDKHDLADFEAAAKVTGSSFYYLKGAGALLELALINYAIKTVVAEGFLPVITPDLARSKVVEGAGFTPRGPEAQIYSVENTDLCLIGTAEITLAGMFTDDTLDAEQFPMKFAGLSHCFRTEAGAAGRATRGLYRVHQFTKVELFVFCGPEQSDAMHDQLLALEEKIFQGLEIPYRVLDISSADLGGPAYRKFDLEAWMPGRGEAGEWGEITSTSNCTDYQARRLNIRYKSGKEKGTRFAHMLNGTAVACGRAIVAILENHQQKDGSIRVPKVLVPYLGMEAIGTTA